MSTNGVQAKTYTNYFSLNAVAGLSRAETGLSLAGFANVVLDSASGVQIAGFANVVGRSTGVEVAGFGNFARRNSSGVQVAGFINASANAGTQVAGFINVAKKVKGVQIAGFINIADSSDYPIAIFNFVKNGEKSIGVSTDETLTTLLSFRSGGRYLYGIAGLGYNHKGQRELAAWEVGLGAHLVSTERFRLNVEVVNVGLTDFKHGDWMKSSLRVLPAYRLGSRVEIFAGPSFNYFRARNGQGEDIVDHYLWSDRNSHCYYGLFFGATGGITISLTKK
ncbi:MAG TPA: hypothetical protein VK518_15910 [Puia sp.]|nr:hypothetical protein [Puia sp.]